jgi:spore maturation protein CgeB
MDFLVVHDSYLIPVLAGRTRGKVPHVYFMSCMASPTEHRPVPLTAEDRRDYAADITFVGGVSANRVALLTPLRKHDLRIFGDPAWSEISELREHYRSEPVYGLKKSKIYHGSKIVLNIEDDEKQINAVSNRVPEVLACGGFVLTDRREDLRRTDLVDGESIATFRTSEELEQKVEFYLRHPEERSRISEAGRRVVLGTLTYERHAGELGVQMASLLHSRRQGNSQR